MAHYRQLRSRLPLVNQLRKASARISYLLQTWQLIWMAARWWTLAWVGLLIAQGLLPIATVYLTRSLVDTLTASIGEGLNWMAVQPLLAPAGGMAGVLLLTELLRGASEWIRTAQAELVQDYISALIHTKSVSIDFGFYESSVYHDRLERARSGASGRSLALLESSGGLMQNSITLLAMAAVLLPYGAWLPPVLVLSTLPAFGVMLQLNQRYHRWWQTRTIDRRRLQYYEMLLTHSFVAAELRLFDLGHHFQSAYQGLRHRLRIEHLTLLRQQSLGRLLAGILSLLAVGAVMAWMVWQALLGLITLGDLALFYQAFHKGQGVMRSSLGNVGQIYKNSLFIQDLFDFLRIQPQIQDVSRPQPVPKTIQQGIYFRQITFRYPGSDRPILKSFDLAIPAGKIVAIVGDNGAGKSTLIKLLCRFYDPDAGHIELDGVDIRQFSVEDYRRLITVLFQFPVPYHESAAQNIILGDRTANPTATEIETAARNAGIHEAIARLPQGYDSQLGKWFPGGTDLSGGEWQRLALARAFLRRAQLIVLDEPTSAMDPWAEFDWLERFRQLADGRTAIVITHRFTLAMRADIIHVMRGGQIVESGHHDQLLAQNGLYAQSWKTQMQQTSPTSSITHIVHNQ